MLPPRIAGASPNRIISTKKMVVETVSKNRPTFDSKNSSAEKSAMKKSKASEQNYAASSRKRKEKMSSLRSSLQMDSVGGTLKSSFNEMGCAGETPRNKILEQSSQIKKHGKNSHNNSSQYSSKDQNTNISQGNTTMSTTLKTVTASPLHQQLRYNETTAKYGGGPTPQYAKQREEDKLSNSAANSTHAKHKKNRLSEMGGVPLARTVPNQGVKIKKYKWKSNQEVLKPVK